MAEQEFDIVVRPMQPADVPGAMRVLSIWHMAPDPNRRDAERSEIVVENSFVAECKSEIVGVASFLLLAEDTAETASLAVDPAFTGRGIGHRLQRARLDRMRSLGIRKVRTETDRESTKQWYVKNFGYRIVGTNPKKHAFSLPDVYAWTVLELDLEE